MKKIIVIATLATLSLSIFASTASAAAGGFCRGTQRGSSICQR